MVFGVHPHTVDAKAVCSLLRESTHNFFLKRNRTILRKRKNVCLSKSNFIS